MRLVRRLFLLLITVIYHTAITAQPHCDVRTFSVRDGLTANFITGIDQDGNGLMWFSTFNGLCCYDGYSFTSFHEAENNELLTTNRISSLKAEGRQGIWLTTYDRRLYFFDTRTCRYEDFSTLLEKRTGKPFFSRNVYTLKDAGYTWITSQHDTECLRIRSGEASHADSMQVITPSDLPLPYSYIKKVRADRFSHEWVFTDQGVVLFGTDVSQQGLFEDVAEVEERIFLMESDGGVWLYTNGARRLQRIGLFPAPRQINGIKEGPSGHLLIATDNGVLALNAKTGMCQTMAAGIGNTTNVNVDHRQRIWAYTDNGVVLIEADGHGQWIHRQVPVSATTNQQTYSEQSVWVEDYWGTIWVAGRDIPFCYYDEDGQQLRPYVLQPPDYDYNVPTIRRCFIDRQHNLWLTSAQSLTLVNLKYRDIMSLPLRPREETRAVLTLSDGTVWAGTSDGVIGIYSAGGRLTGYLGSNGRVTTSPASLGMKIYAFHQTGDGRIWIGTRGNGLCTYENGQLTHYRHDVADDYSLSSDEVFDFDEDEQGNLWIATYGGGLNLVRRMADGSLRFIHPGNEMDSYPREAFRHVRDITHDGRGTIIMSTNEGLLTFSNRFTRPQDIRFYQSCHVRGDTTSIRTSDVIQALVTRNGQTYVTTMGGSIQRLKSERLLQDNLKFTTPPGQTFGNVLSLTEDGNGNVWVVHENTLEMFKPEVGLMAMYGPNELGSHIGFTESKATLDPRSGQLVFPTYGGIVTLHPDQVRRNNYQPGIVFTNVLFQGDLRPHPLLNKPELSLPSDRRDLTVCFAALDYHDNGMVCYAYKLKGTDHDWHYLGHDHVARLSNLKAGHHCLVVKSTNSDGVWCDNETELYIYVKPTFWETIWAKMLYLLVFAGVVGLAVHVYLLRQKNAMQRKMDERKTQFYTDVSHQLRTPLTLIGGPVTEVLAGEQLSDKARSHLEMVRRNAFNMLELVNKMLEHVKDRHLIVDDKEAPVFANNASFVVPDGDAADATQSAGQETRLLIVEDNDDLRAFLVSILQDDYTVSEAPNGRVGLEKAVAEQPDFIITDVMMPEMDGLTMVYQIKQNADICHIPIIVLSAKASLDDRLQGLKEGIDDYITKPFSAIYLRQRIENIISGRRMLQQAWLGMATQSNAHKEYKLDTPQIVDADQELMETLMKYIENRIGDEDLKIEDLADAVHLGRTVFYGKIKALVGMAPSDFLRHVRMQRAEELIAKSKMNFSQIAYSVGFSDPKYFTKCFKKETGMTPSEYREKARGEALSE